MLVGELAALCNSTVERVGIFDYVTFSWCKYTETNATVYAEKLRVPFFLLVSLYQPVFA